MNELLKRWAELEPTLCEISKDGVCLFTNDEWVFIYTLPFDADMFIQYAVQQAIVARGWRFGIQLYSGFQVWVAAPNSRYCWATNADNLTTALLAAYVQVLCQAQAKALTNSDRGEG